MNANDEVIAPSPDEIRTLADVLERLSEADGVPLPEMAEWSPSLLRARAVIGEDELAAEAALVADVAAVIDKASAGRSPTFVAQQLVQRFTIARKDFGA